MSEVTRKTFDDIDNIKGQLGVLFDKSEYTAKKQDSIEKKIDDLHKKIEKKKLYDRASSAIGGFFGGMVAFGGAVLGKMFLS